MENSTITTDKLLGVFGLILILLIARFVVPLFGLSVIRTKKLYELGMLNRIIELSRKSLSGEFRSNAVDTYWDLSDKLNRKSKVKSMLSEIYYAKVVNDIFHHETKAEECLKTLNEYFEKVGGNERTTYGVLLIFVNSINKKSDRNMISPKTMDTFLRNLKNHDYKELVEICKIIFWDIIKENLCNLSFENATSYAEAVLKMDLDNRDAEVMALAHRVKNEVGLTLSRKVIL
jgi:hypothetical protein